MEDLKFKVILGTVDRREAFLKAIKAAGVNGNIVDANFIDGANFAWLDYKFGAKSFFYNTTNHADMFEDCDYPLIRLDNAIARLEKYAANLQPGFPFKAFDRVLRQLNKNAVWIPDMFSYCDQKNFFVIGEVNDVMRVAIFEGNEKHIDTTNNPPEWWEIKDGKPVLVKRGE